MTPGGVIQRVRTDPLGVDYLSLDGAVPQWTQDRKDALFFDRVEEADERAKAMGGRPIFAVVATKPIPRSHVTRCNEDDFIARHRRRRHLITSEIPT